MKKNKSVHLFTIREVRAADILLVGLLLASGALLGWWRTAQADVSMRHDLVRRARLVADGIDPRSVARLSGSETDRTAPEYRRIKKQSVSLIAAFPDCRFISLVGRRPDGSLFLYFDSEPEGSPDESAPGESYAPADSLLLHAFDEGRSVVAGPFMDMWGSLVSAWVPVVEPDTRKTLFVVALDIDGNRWRDAARRAGIEPNLASVALAFVFVGWRMLATLRSHRKRSAYRWYHRYAEALAVAAAGVVLTFSVLCVSSDVERRTLEKTFHMLADSESEELNNSLKSLRNIGMEGIAAFFAYSDFVDFEEFVGYSRHLEALPEIRGVTWLPAVPHEEREAFERLARSLVADDFVIRDPAETAKRAPARESPVYYPVLYRVPFEGNGRILGMDFGQSPSRKGAIEEARRTGLPSATEALPPGSDSGTPTVLAVFKPVLSRNEAKSFMGVVGVIVELNALLNTMRTEEAHVERAVLVGDLWSLHGDGARTLLLTTAEATAASWAWPGAADLFSVRPLLFFGKTFAVILRPGPGFYALYPPRAAWMSLSAGLLVTGVLTLLAVAAANRREDLERLVAARTDELQRSRDELSLMNVALLDTTRKAQEMGMRARAASEAKGRFFANMSHEMRTPLNGLLGMNRLLLDSPLSEEQRESALSAQECGEALLSLVSDALDIANIDEGRYRLVAEDFDLYGLLLRLETVFGLAARVKGLRFAFAVAPSVPPRLHSDGHCLYRILRNLLDNAVKFTREGEVGLSVASVEESEESVRLRFSVKDTGTGIPAAFRESVFERFWQGDDSSTKKYGGAGLGLPVAKELASLLGGSLALRSEEGRGSEFVFEASFTKALAQETPRVQEGTEHGGKILLAEDNPVNRKFVLTVLRRLGYSVAFAENGAEALEHLAANECDLVVMDVQMPVMDGVEATRRIRSGESGALDPSIPIVALTAYVSPLDRERCMHAGMNAFLAKPATPEALHRTIRSLLSGAGPADPEAPSAAAVAAETPETPVFDRAAALNRLMGDEEALAELAAEFGEEMPRELEKFLECVAEGDAVAAGRVAHSLKGAAAGIGGEALRATAFEAEKAGKAGDSDSLRRLRNEVRTQYALLERALREVVSGREESGV